MKNVLNSIWNFIKKYYKQIIIGILLLFVVLLLCQNCSIRSDSNSTIVVMTDSLTQYKNKNKELYDAQTTYITKIKELESINKELYDEAKSLKDNPLIVTVVKTEYKVDTIYTEVKDFEKDSLNNTYSYKWNDADEYYNIEGISIFNLNENTGKTDIYNLNFESNVTLDVIENSDGKLQIIVKTDNPYCTIKEVNGAILSPDKIKSIQKWVKNKNRWGVGVQAGVGAGINGQNIIFTPYIGVGISYNIITF